MTLDPEQHDLISDEKLDELLANAEWPEVDHSRKRGLDRFLNQLIHRSRPKRVLPVTVRYIPAVALVAASLLVLLFWTGFFAPKNDVIESNKQPTLETDADNKPTFSPQIATDLKESESEHELSVSAEWQAVLRTHLNRNARPTPQPNSSITWPKPFRQFAAFPKTLAKTFTRETITASFHQMAASPIGTVATESFVNSLDHAVTKPGSRVQRKSYEVANKFRRRWEARLRERVNKHLAQRQPGFSKPDFARWSDSQKAELRLLCQLSTDRSLPTLARVYGTIPELGQDLRDRVFSSLVEKANSKSLIALAKQPLTDAAKVELMAELVSRPDPFSVNAFITLAERWASRDLVAQSAAKANRLSVNAYWQQLESPKLKVRMIAATVLAYCDEPQLSQRLIQMAHQPQKARAAFLALVARRDAESVHFIRHAENQIQWVGTLRTARNTWDRLAP